MLLTPDIQQLPPSQDSPLSLVDLISSRDSVRPAQPTQDVAQMFRDRPELEAVAVVEDTMPLGLIMSQKLMTSLSQQYGYSLFAKKPILTLAEQNFLAVSATEPLSDVLDAALSRDHKNIYDDILVVDDQGFFLGLLSMRRLMVQQNTAYATALAERKLATARASELARIGKMKSQFIAHASHELRSPVNVVIGIIELLQRQVASKHDARTDELLAMAASTAAGLRALITNILDLSKLEAGKLELRIAPIDTRQLVKGILEETRILLAGKPVALEARVPDAHISLASDEMRLRQVLLNLCSNAAKFTEQGCITLAVDDEWDYVRFSVQDTGPGISDESLSRMFEPFEQDGDAKTKSIEGTGLGLAISKHLADVLGGRIGAESMIGEGSTFWIEMNKSKTACEESRI